MPHLMMMSNRAVRTNASRLYNSDSTNIIKVFTQTAHPHNIFSYYCMKRIIFTLII